MTAAKRFTLSPPGSRPRRRTRMPAPWQRIDHGDGKTRYAHPRGYWVEHCGHPTALYPYALNGPDGALILAPNGRAWRTLADVALEVARRTGERAR